MGVYARNPRTRFKSGEYSMYPSCFWIPSTTQYFCACFLSWVKNQCLLAKSDYDLTRWKTAIKVRNVFSGAVAETDLSKTVCFQTVFSTWHYNTPLTDIHSKPFGCSYFLFSTLTAINNSLQPHSSFLSCDLAWHISLRMVHKMM